jgi:hypothetical protein
MGSAINIGEVFMWTQGMMHAGVWEIHASNILFV